MALIKKCRHGKGKQGRARIAAWRGCQCQWLADIRVNGQRVYVPLGTDERRAKIEHAQLVADREADRLTVTPHDTGTVAGLCDEWLRRQTTGLKPTSIRNYRARLAVVRRYFGDTAPVARIRTHTLAEFRDDLHADLAPTYAHGVYTAWLGVLAWAEAEQLAARIPPPPRNGRRTAPIPKVDRMSIPEAEATIAAVTDPRLAAMAEVALLTGLRRGELLGLTPAAVRPGVLIVDRQVTELGPSTPKTTASARAVGLSPRAQTLLDGAAAGLPEDAPLFPFHHQYAKQRLRAAMEAAGTYRRGRGWHSLRHGNTALREQAGQSIRGAAAALGHGANYARTLAYGWAAEAGPAPELDRAREG